jgi:hypothetical protein
MDHDDSRTAFYCGQAGGQKQDCAIITESLPCIVEHGFGIGIEWGFRFFDDEQSGLACCSASEADAETLSDVQLQSVFSESGFVAAWQAADEVVGVYQFGCFDSLLFCDVRTSAGDIFEDGGIEHRVVTTDEDGFLPE